ncbi:hypothetical protein BH708_06055 [Brachybacterium sp. P6-10-X1]|uniref:GvpL/GvpF family gas vesicle protein n=1 Tax=Brachybacterium sp. P6-10-X1 TaxID=1903186 RepID=UPI0009717EE5|nr:GvpL/GvpF family gas vesicle protein [Brachybacterium sp. P6-10-X1]APX32356.1 hypothetical protein BH708_06055 [Brachybacterium sp. P6-10-X1]
MSEQALYVYAIVPPEGAAEPGSGIDGREVLAVGDRHGAVALVHRQDTVPFEGPDDDVRRWVVQHSEVIDRAWQTAGTALPVSFNVIVGPSEGASPEESLRGWLRENAATVRERLAALTDHVELRIEISVDSSTADDDPEIQRLEAEMAARPEGVQRLYRKKLDTQRRDVTDRLADELYPELRRRILAHAVDVVENRRSRAAEGSVPVLSIAVLVAESEIAPLGVELADIRDSRPGIDIRFLGPWPPYSFADLPAMGPGPTSEGA